MKNTQLPRSIRELHSLLINEKPQDSNGLSKLLKKYHITHEKLADKSHMSLSSIQKFSSQNQIPSNIQIEGITRAINAIIEARQESLKAYKDIFIKISPSDISDTYYSDNVDLLLKEEDLYRFDINNLFARFSELASNSDTFADACILVEFFDKLYDYFNEECISFLDMVSSLDGYHKNELEDFIREHSKFELTFVDIVKSEIYKNDDTLAKLRTIDEIWARNEILYISQMRTHDGQIQAIIREFEIKVKKSFAPDDIDTYAMFSLLIGCLPKTDKFCLDCLKVYLHMLCFFTKDSKEKCMELVLREKVEALLKRQNKKTTED